MAAALAALLYVLLIELSPVFVVVFCAVLLAVLLSGTARVLAFRGTLPHVVALGLVLLLLTGATVALVAWIGPQLASQIGELQGQVQLGFEQAQEWLQSTELGERIQGWLPSLRPEPASATTILSRTQSILSHGLGLLAYLLSVAILGIFLASSPDRYAHGVLRLVSPRSRQRVEHLLTASGHALRVWLAARLVLMLFVGVAFGIGLWLLGIRLALPLAVLAGLLNFVPYVGPAVALVPAVAVALLSGPRSASYVVLLYLVVQFIESYVAQPLIEARAVSLPPALILVAQLICSLWLGAVGLLLATPILLVVVIAVQVFYQQGVLGQSTRVAGS